MFVPIHIKVRPGICSFGTFSSRRARPSTSPTSSGLKNPIPHSPTTPAIQRIMPTTARPRQRRSPNKAVYDPNFTPVNLPASRALTHFSGSFNRN